MKVLFFSHYSEMYGANKSMFNLILDLRDRYGIVPAIICSYMGDNKLIEEAKKHNIEIHVVEYKYWMNYKYGKLRHLKNSIRRIENELYNRSRIKKIVDIASEFNPDIIHINNSVANLGAEVAQRLNVPYVWHIREFGWDDYKLVYTVPKKIVQEQYEGAACLIAISDSIERHCLQIAPNARMKKIYNGIKPFDISKDEHATINFCCIGLLQEPKNQMEILLACNHLKNFGIERFKLYLVGSGATEYIEKLKNYVQENALTDNVIFTGYQEQVLTYLAKSDIGIMSSRNEAFGRVTIEYMLAKMPVIGTNSGGTPEIIENGTTGYLYESGNSMELAKKMQSYIEHKEQIKSMGQAGYVRAIEYFTIEKNTDNIYETYKAVMDR